MSAVLVAVVVSSGHSEMARGLLRRCGFLVVEVRSLDDTRRLIARLVCACCLAGTCLFDGWRAS